MATIVLENSRYKIVKTFETDGSNLGYTAFCFFLDPNPFGGAFRAIYSVHRNLDTIDSNFTVWLLDKTKGVWGCFADAHDLGFDHRQKYAEKVNAMSPEEQEERTVEKLVAIEDEIFLEFVEVAKAHTKQLFTGCSFSSFEAEPLRLVSGS
jgi:hypothetical protein